MTIVKRETFGAGAEWQSNADWAHTVGNRSVVFQAHRVPMDAGIVQRNGWLNEPVSFATAYFLKDYHGPNVALQTCAWVGMELQRQIRRMLERAIEQLQRNLCWPDDCMNWTAARRRIDLVRVDSATWGTSIDVGLVDRTPNFASDYSVTLTIEATDEGKMSVELIFVMPGEPF